MTQPIATPHPHTIFLNELTDTLRSPSSPDELARAIAAHRAYQRWEQSPTLTNWRLFQRKYYRI